MGKKLAIEHHLIRPNEVIELLEMMGGKNKDNADGCSFLYYTLCTPKTNNPNNDKVICGFTNLKMQNDFFAIFTLEKFWEKYPFKVGDKVVYEDDNDIVVISEIKWDNTVGDIFYNVKKIDEDDSFLCPPEVLKPYKNKFPSFEPMFKMNDELEYKIPDGYEITEVSKDKVFIKPIKSKYPKTYEECEKILGLEDSIIEGCLGYEYKLLNAFQKLLMCRDAYWKIAGEELELSKPWKPDWNGHEFKYGLKFMGHRIEKTSEMTVSHVICFSTEEMRDAFYENFKDLIEQCKELL